MTVLAGIGCLSVRRVLTGCVGAVVTTEAVVRDIGVIEVRRYPGDGGVAVITIVTTANVV